MSRDRLSREDFTHEKAADLVAHIVRERERWGKHYKADDIGLDVLLDALIWVSQHGSEDTKDLRDSISTLNRQLGAARARETRLTKLLAEAKGVATDEG